MESLGARRAETASPLEALSNGAVPILVRARP